MIEKDEIKDIRDYKNRLANFSNEFDFGLFVYIVRRSLIWITGALVLAVICAFLYLRYTPVVFEASSVIQLAENDNANKILKVENVDEENQVEAKLEQLRSKLLISRTLQELPLKVSYYAKGQILTNEHYQYSPYKIELIDVIDPTIQDQIISISFNSPGSYSISYRGQMKDNLQVNQEVQTPEFSMKVVIENWDELKKNQEEYELFFKINSLTALTNRFYNSLNVHILNKTAKTLQLSIKDNNPYIARDFIRAHANEFIRFDLEKKRKSDDNILSFLDEQIDTVFARLKQSESDLNQYKQENKITNLESVSNAYLERMTDYEGEIIAIQLEEGILDEVQKLAQRNTKDVEVHNLIPLVAGSRHEETLSKLLDQLYVLLHNKEDALYNVTPESERIRSMDYKIEVQKKLILQTVDGLRSQLHAKKESLNRELDKTENTYYEIPQKELEYARLQRLFNINEKYYTLLLEKAIEYRISKEGFVSNNQILEEVRVPLMPVSPRRNMVWFTFLLCGLLISLMIVAVRYLMHNELTSLGEISKYSDGSIAVLGIIPKYRLDIPVSMLIVDKNPRSLIAESFRSVRTNLQFIDNTPGTKLITVTSTISGEGKTFVSLNLAGIIAFSGKRVVVCDVDMRKPKIHKGFGVSNDAGMSTLLIQKGNLDTTIRKSQLENLDFITAGPIPPNPSELIISDRMNELINELKTRYDVIIFDTPPVGLVTDAVAMLQKSDYPVYVFRSDYSRKQFIQVADKLVNENKILLSAILNGVDIDRNKYGYRYGYGYGYNYGNNGYYDDSSSRGKNLFRKKAK